MKKQLLAATLPLLMAFPVCAQEYPVGVNQLYFEDNSNATVTLVAADSAVAWRVVGFEVVTPTALTTPVTLYCGTAFSGTDRLSKFDLSDKGGFFGTYWPMTKDCATNKALTIGKTAGDTVRGYIWYVKK